MVKFLDLHHQYLGEHIPVAQLAVPQQVGVDSAQPPQDQEGEQQTDGDYAAIAHPPQDNGRYPR